ncbi:MAG TPA: choice-of-anchor Q domain-containing protein, partial [Pyrinomonadaceae bacterium]|nr:choice-of-anchor Q domain-containing protein [Pyrinomonadaceae bacterium]
LGPLANNGGPTLTHALLPGSPAIDAGSNALALDQNGNVLTTDQRGVGFNRSADGNGDGAATTDIGAYEVQSLLVTNLNDSGAGSLRQAISDANARLGTDAINFQAGLTGVISLSTVLPDLSTSMAINGPGANLVTVQRSAAGGTPAFAVLAVTNGTVTISGVTVSNGLANPLVGGGGGVRNSGVLLTLLNVNVTGNQTMNGLPGGGIFNSSGILTVQNSTINNNVTTSTGGGDGGGIYNSGGTVNLINSTISGNRTGNGVSTNPGGNGGGIWNIGTLTISNSTISGNQTGDGGPSSNGGGGAGIFSLSTTNISNSTISANRTGGPNNAPGGGAGIVTSAAPSITFTLTNVTITGNQTGDGTNGFGGGIQQGGGTTSLRNTIVANNLAGTGADLFGSFTSQDFNLIRNTAGGTISGTTTHNIIGMDPLLGPLANNGGPTLTHALLPNSPALDAGDNCVTQAVHCGDANISQLTSDQRGTPFNRLVDGPDADTTATIDIGAYETQSSLSGIADLSTNEDASVQTAFDVGDASDVTSITASSSNTNLVSNDVAHLTVNAFGSTQVVTIVPVTNANGTTNITITVNRTGGSASKTFALTVNAVNDAPSFTKGQDQTFNEDSGSHFIAPWATNISAGPSDESGQTLTFVVTNNTNTALFSSGPTISSAGQLSFTSASNANGSATITIVLKDNGGTADGGVDTSASQSFTITVNPVNDAPSFIKGSNQTVNNNAGAQTVNNWATNISPGPPDESGQTVAFHIVSNTNSTIFTVAPAVSPSGTLTYTPNPNGGGTATITINLKDNGGTANGGIDTSSNQSFTITVNPIGGFISFTSSSANTTENSGSTIVTVRRTGDTSRAATVDYATNGDSGLPCSTASGVASPKCDFTAAIGTLNFAPGDINKTITILIGQDSFVEGPEVITLTLANPQSGAALGTPESMAITIADDVPETTTNIIDDPNLFVRMHYHDFLNREGDQSGLDFWTGQMTNCGSSDLTVCRVNVSGSFFLSIEFQQTGYLVERMYKVAYGDATGVSTLGGSHSLSVPRVDFGQFLQDTQRIGRNVVVLAPGWEQDLENNKQAYAMEFVQTKVYKYLSIHDEP